MKQNSSLLTSLVFLVLAIIVIVYQPSLLGPFGFISPGILVVISIIFLCVFLRIRFSLKWLTLIVIFLGSVILLLSIYFIVVLVGSFLTIFYS